MLTREVKAVHAACRLDAAVSKAVCSANAGLINRPLPYMPCEEKGVKEFSICEKEKDEASSACESNYVDSLADCIMGENEVKSH